MHRILVEEKRWISEQRFLHALNYWHAAAGPRRRNSSRTYIGWLMHRTLGGIIAGGLFVVPGIIAIMGLSYVYAAWGNVPIIVALFFGLKAAVLAIVVEALVRIGKRGAQEQSDDRARSGRLHRHLLLERSVSGHCFWRGDHRLRRGGNGCYRLQGGRGHAAGKEKAAVVDDMLGEGIPEHARPTLARALGVSAIWLALWLVAVIALLATLGSANVFSQIAVFFSKMAVVTFGGAYAVLAYVAQQAVENYGWLKPGEMLDGLGMAETTPGPLIMVLQFVGFMAAFREPGTLAPMLAGTLGGLLATWVTSPRASSGSFSAHRSSRSCAATRRSTRRSPPSRRRWSA